MSKPMAFFNALFLVCFCLSAAVQFNDPDALPWIVVYLAAAALCLLAFADRLPTWLPRAMLALCLVWAVYLLPRILGEASLSEVFASISMQTRAVEEAREIGGLLLIALWSGVLGWGLTRPAAPESARRRGAE